MIFPLEIWEIVFQYSDAIALVNLRRVCRLWRDAIDKILAEKDHWYRQCEEDVPEHFWHSFYEKLNPEIEIHNIAINDSNKWFAMYKSWMTCKNVAKCNVDLGYFNPVAHYNLRHTFTQHITCFKVLNHLLAVGTSAGFVYVYDIDYLCESPIFIGDHLEYIKSVHFLRNGTNTAVVSCSVNNHVKFWDIELQKLVKNIRGQIMCANSYHLCIALNNVFFIEKSTSCASSEYNYAKHNIVLGGIDNDMLVLYTQSGDYEKYSLHNQNLKFSSQFLSPPASKVRRFYVFKPEILVYISNEGLLGFSIGADGWWEYNLHSALDGTPTAILIYDHLIILGLNTGIVHMYYFQDLCFELLDFNPKNSKVISLDPTAIISMEIFFHNEEQYLAVAQMQKIHIIQFI